MGCGCNGGSSLTQGGGGYEGPQFSTEQSGGGTRRRKRTRRHRRSGTRKMRAQTRMQMSWRMQAFYLPLLPRTF
jgi:hypothetical protein